MRNTALLAISFLLALSQPAKAEMRFSMVPSLLHFDYTEFGTDGSTLDNETGWLPGLQLQLDTGLQLQSSIGLELSVYDGSIDYNGQTQSGAAHTTRTDETLVGLGAYFRAPLTTHSHLVIGAKYNEWERNINDNNGVSGLLEIYNWWEYSAGAVVEFWKQDQQSWQAGAAVIRSIRPTLYVDLSRANFGSTELELGSDWGSRLQLAWTQRQAPGSHISVAAFHETRDFGRSNTRATSGGAGSLFVTEPHSETRNSGLLLVISRLY